MKVGSVVTFELLALGLGEVDSYVFPSQRGIGTSFSTGDLRCLSELGTSSRVPCSPTPTEAQSCHAC